MAKKRATFAFKPSTLGEGNKLDIVGSTYYDADCPGLFIRVNGDGSATFVFRMRETGASGQETLSTYPKDASKEAQRDAITAARSQAKDFRALWRAQGGKKEISRGEVPTLLGLIDLYEDARLAGDPRADPQCKPMPKDWEQRRGFIELIYRSALQSAANRITEDDLLDCQRAYLTKRLEETGKRPHSTVVKASNLLRDILSSALGAKWVLPVVAKVPVVGGRKRSNGRKRFVLPGELQRVFPALDAVQDDAGLALRFLLAQGCRLSMAIDMKWSELSLQPLANWPLSGKTEPIMTWIVPPERMKVGDLAIMPVVGEARRIVDEMAKLTQDKGGFVFPDAIRRKWRVYRKNDDAGGGGNANIWQRKVFEFSGTHSWTRHDLRRTHATYLGYLDIDLSVIKQSLAHAGATAIYERSSAFRKLARAHLRLHQALADIEAGRPSEAVDMIQGEIPFNEHARTFMAQLKIGNEMIAVQSAAEAA